MKTINVMKILATCAEATKQIQQTIQNGTDDVLDSVHSAVSVLCSHF